MRTKILIICLLSVSTIYGTNLTKTIRPSNGDYTSINAGISANSAMSQDTLFLNCDSSMVSSTAIALTSGYGSNKWIIVRGIGAGRCSTSVDTTCHFFTHSANSAGIGISANVNVVFDGIRFKFTQANISNRSLFLIAQTNTTKVIIKNCIMQGVFSGTSANSACVNAGGIGKTYVINSVINGFRNSINVVIGVYSSGVGCTAIVYNTTIVKSRFGLYRGANGTFVAVNDYIDSDTIPIYNFSGTRSNIAVSDSVWSGISGVIIVPFNNTTFIDTVTDNYDIPSLSGLVNQGIHNLTLSYPLNYTTDFEDSTRSKNFDIGAFEYHNVPITFSPYATSVKCRTGVTFLDTVVCTDILWDSCTVDQFLPDSVSLNKLTGVTSGRTNFRSSTNYKYYIWVNGNKEDSATIRIRFYSPLITPPDYYITPTNHIGTDYLWYGINAWYSSSDLSTFNTYQQDLNSKIVRFDIHWYFIQPSEGVYNWAKTDSAVNALPTGCQALFTIYCTSSWAIKTRVYQGDTLTTIMPPTAPLSYNDYYDFVYALANRYKKRVQFFQIENEVYAAYPFWYATDQEYLDLLKTGYKAIKTANPYAQVLASSIALATVDVTQPIPPQYEYEVGFFRLIARQAVNYYDIIDMHLYYKLLPSIPDRMAWIKTETALNRKPIWITETGGLDQREYPEYNDQKTQSIDLVKRYSLVFGDTADRVFWLHVYPPENQTLPWTGIRLTEDRYATQKRAAYYTFKLLIDKIDQFVSTVKLTIGTKFIVANKPVVIAWNTNDTTVDLSSHFSTSNVIVTHIVTDSNRTVIDTNIYSKTSIPVDSIPVFIEEE